MISSAANMTHGTTDNARGGSSSNSMPPPAPPSVRAATPIAEEAENLTARAQNSNTSMKGSRAVSPSQAGPFAECFSGPRPCLKTSSYVGVPQGYGVQGLSTSRFNSQSSMANMNIRVCSVCVRGRQPCVRATPCVVRSLCLFVSL